MLQLEPGRDVRIVIELRHENLVAALQGACQRPGEQEVERGHAGAEGDLARVAPEKTTGGIVRAPDQLRRSEAGRVRRADVRVVGAQVVGDRVDHLVRALGAAGAVEERHGPVERREPRAHRVHVQIRADSHPQNLHAAPILTP